MNLLKATKALFRQLARTLERFYVLARIRYHHGPVRQAEAKSSFVVFTLVRNAEEHLEDFIRYYSKLGAERIFVIDNASVDSTFRIAKLHDKVVLFSTKLKFSRFECAIRRYFIQRYCRHTWVLAVDVDEFFDFPRLTTPTMTEFTAYLGCYGYTAVTACMLDMFARDPAAKSPADDLLSKYQYLDVESIEKAPYPVGWLTRNNAVPDHMCIYKNGIRKRALGTDREFLLVKHPLMFISDEIIPFTHPHYCAQARIADVVCALLHFKFTERVAAKAVDIVADATTDPTWAAENRLYAEAFLPGSALLSSSHAQKYTSVMDLADGGLLYISDTYRTYRPNATPL